VSDDDSFLQGIFAIMKDYFPVIFRHGQTVGHHQGTYMKIHFTSPQSKHFEQMCILEIQLPGEFIVGLIECPACDEYPNNHFR
jgi:hypothetical protein